MPQHEWTLLQVSTLAVINIDEKDNNLNFSHTRVVKTGSKIGGRQINFSENYISADKFIQPISLEKNKKGKFVCETFLSNFCFVGRNLFSDSTS